MNTYTKFLIRSYLYSILNVFFIFFSLIYILNLLTELEFFKRTDVNYYFPLYLSLINTPMFVFEMFPFIFLISTQFFLITFFQIMKLIFLNTLVLKIQKYFQF